MKTKFNFFVAILSLLIGILIAFYYFNNSQDVKYRYTFQLSYTDVRSLYDENLKFNNFTNELVRICPFKRGSLDMIVKYSENLMPNELYESMLAVDMDRGDDCTTFNFILVSKNKNPNIYLQYYKSDLFINRLIEVSHAPIVSDKISLILVSSKDQSLSKTAIIFNSISLLIFSSLLIFFVYFLLIKLYFFISLLIRK